MVQGTMIASTPHYDIYVHNVAWYASNKATVESFIGIVEASYMAATATFGFELPPNSNTSNQRYIVELSDENTGLSAGAGGEGLGFSGGLVLAGNFLRYSFATHETANIFTGSVTGGWPWANGSYIWRALNDNHSQFTSPFPYMMSVVMLQNMGRKDYAQRKVADVTGVDHGFDLLYGIFQTYGIGPYTTLIQLIRALKVDLTRYQEPVKTAIVAVFMGAGSGLNFVNEFNATFTKYNVIIPQSAVDNVYGLFPSIPTVGITQADTAIMLGAVAAGLFLIWWGMRN